MKVSCPACDSQYTIADEKVSGRKVKVRCKSCGGQILVDGTAQTAPSEAAAAGSTDEENDATRVFTGAERSAFDAEHAAAEVTTDDAPSSSSGEVTWSVNVSETDERTLSTDQVVDGYLSGELAGEVFVWRDGMGDWLLITDVPELKQAIEAKRGPKSKPAGSSPIAASPGSRPVNAKPDTAAKSEKTPAPASAQAKKTLPGAATKTAAIATKPAATATGAAASKAGLGAGVTTSAGVATAAADKKTAARVTNVKRPQSAHDLFAAASQPSEDVDVSVSQEDEHKPTGARNESSVLFSLDALKAGIVTSPQPTAAPSKGPPGRKGPPVAPKKKMEDLMSGAAANAPLITGAVPGPLMMSSNQALLTAPAPPPPKPAPKPVEPEIQAPKETVQATAVAPTPAAAPQKSKKGLLIGAAVAAVAVIAGIAVAVTGGGDKDKANAEASASAAPSVAAPSVVAEQAKPEPTKPAEPPPAETKPAEPVASASAAPSTPAPVAVAAGQGTPSASKGNATTTTKKEETKKETKKEETTSSAPAAGAFSKDAAIQALNVAASQASSCKKPDGPTGTGKVQVTFAPSGRATTAVIVGGSFGGTPVGGCVSNVFKRARVPAFSGNPVTVSKSFSIIP
ncbi:MAG: zinc-ribbon domain-containing protein [Polyangiaceae bacterium]